MESKSSVIFKRFLRVFIATAIPVVTLELAKGYDLSNPVDIKRFILSLITPLISGLLVAADKYVRWVEPEIAEPLTNEDEA
jgi:ABC-type anion transport system duplicated permease subunit